MSNLLADLSTRADHKCELCGQTESLAPYLVEHAHKGVDASTHVLTCSVCTAQLNEEAPMEDKHWFGLQESIWSQYPVVQALSYRVLWRLREHGWASDLLEQAYLEEDVLAWATVDISEDADDVVPTRDSNGTVLQEGDAVTLIKDLDVKGTSFTAKRGTMVKNIRLTDNPEHIEGRVNGMTIVLKTQFLKRA